MALLSRGVRKFALTAHICSSVGWLGAIAGFLAIAVTGLLTQDGQIVRAAYLGMDWIGWYVLVPISFASLLTGLIQSLGTEWGLFRHYWVVAKLLINVLANVVLLLYMLELSSVVAMLPSHDAGGLKSASPVLHASVALGLLLVATILAVYKPRGITPYGWRRHQELRRKAWEQRQHSLAVEQ
jgi:hypothetical protein